MIRRMHKAANDFTRNLYLTNCTAAQGNVPA
jgi:hypothetical protein